MICKEYTKKWSLPVLGHVMYMCVCECVLGGGGLNYKDWCWGRLKLGTSQLRGKVTDNWITNFGNLLYEHRFGGA
jgi:hypothetical protein